MRRFTTFIDAKDLPSFARTVTEFFREITARVDGISSGNLSAYSGQATSAPSTGSWSQGDYIKNSSPTELGTAGSKYWIRGWWCETSGSPGTWKQDRGLTGN